jgi:outer membrane protein assembly factor BamE (lipoprotein component of BamABCDE complex)
MARQRSSVVQGKLALALVLVATAAALAGCATVGNGAIAQLDAQSAAALLVPGKTTQADVRLALGQGDVIHFESGFETWHYFYRQGLGAGWDAVPYINLITEHLKSPTKELVLLFDGGGLLRRWSFDASQNSMSESGKS